MQLMNIPAELRNLDQWVCAGTGKHPLNPYNGKAASVIDRSTWGTFNQAKSTGMKIGFVLTAEDPFTIIDLDNKVEDPASPAEIERHHKILTAFDSYTERSTSGTGYHIIVKGAIPTGVHRDKVEVYSTGRYMICTGDVVRNSPVKEYQEWLTILYNEMAPPKQVELIDRAAMLEDGEVFEMAISAINAAKFNQLCSGQWQGEYPSQSEADFALLSIFTFYTPNNDQVKRLFRMTALGKREKATKNDVYLNRALQKIRGMQTPELDLSQLAANAQAIIGQLGNSPEKQESTPLPQEHAHNEPEPPTSADPHLSNVVLPPGIIGELAVYFYETAIRPVPEVALAAAIALVAGIVGRSYNISGSGLNQYIILLARTGSGKEGAASGIESLIAAVRPQIPMADEFIGPAAFASGQSLIKVLDARPCFVSVLGEFGITLQEISDPRANSAQKMLKKVLLDLYAKSGWNKTLRSSVYSDIEKNTKIIQAPNVTIFGESTPEGFYNGLDVSHIEDGLIPRFSIIEYTGPRPALNKNANIPPPAQLLTRFADLIAVAMTTSNNHACCLVNIEPDALILLDEFEVFATDKINHTRLSVEVQLWNRAHLKVLKLAALIAVGINPHAPLVNVECAGWAIAFVRGEITGVAKRFSIGDVGQGDGKQMLDIKHAVESFFKMTAKQLASYELSEETTKAFSKAGVIPYRFLIKRLITTASFKNDRNGATSAIKKAIQVMLDAGLLMEIPKIQASQAFGFAGACYGVSKDWKRLQN
jgi:hypothetical protein